MRIYFKKDVSGVKVFPDEKTVIAKIHSVNRYDRDTVPKVPNEYSSSPGHYELIYILNGEGLVTADGTEMQDLPGTIRYLPKGRMKGKYTSLPYKVPFSCIDIYFDTDSAMPLHAFNFEADGKYRDKFARLLGIWQKRDINYYAVSMAVFYDLIACLQNEAGGYLSGAQRKYMEKAHEYAVRHFTDADFDYSALCCETGLKYSHFSVLFGKNYGMSPVKYITKMRVDYAKELLITGRYTVTQIAEMCGFSDVYYFSAVFKKETGFSPTRYSVIT